MGYGKPMNGKDDKTLKHGEYDLPATMNEDVPILARLNLDTLQQNLMMIRWLSKCQPHKLDHLKDIVDYVDKAINMVDEVIVKNCGELIDRRIRERRLEEEQPPDERRDEDRRQENLGRRNKL